VLKEDHYRKKMGLGQDGNNLVVLLSALAISFCIFKCVWTFYKFSGLEMEAYYRNVLDWFRLPPDVNKFMTRPWTLLTYMIVHDDPFRLLGNILWLWAFGYILQDMAGNKKLIPIYIYGALVGALVFILSYNIFPKLALSLPAVPPLEGSAAGALAVAIATTTLAPDYRIFPMINGGVPLWVLTIIFVVVDVASMPVPNAANYLAHFSGAFMGFFFVYRLRKGKDWSIWMNTFFEWVNNLFNPEKKSWKKTAKDDLYYNSKGTQPYKKIPNITQKRIDEILDKINQQGYRFLTDEEKEILKRAAEDEEL
jgi:membrane associated rhomboid family serine protease